MKTDMDAAETWAISKLQSGYQQEVRVAMATYKYAYANSARPIGSSLFLSVRLSENPF